MNRPYYQDEGVTLHHGDARSVLATMSDRSPVNCVVTSPPYYNLRDYGVAGQVGAERSPAEYVKNLRDIFMEVHRVLADDGTMWLNLGDTYGRDKNMLGIPWRVAFALQDAGWFLRSEIIWAKRNLKPENVTDRPTQAHEQVFLFTKKPRYWYDADAIREESDPEQEAHNQRYAKEYAKHTARAATTGQPGNVNNVGIHSRPGKGGRNSRTVWSISAQPFSGAHFAVMPSELAERCVLAGCKPGGVVLDPFSGSGTTGMVAAKHGRHYVGIDLNAHYLDLSLRTRLAQPGLDFGEATA